MAEDGYPIVKALQDRGVDAHLYVTYPNFVCSLPQWELCDLDVDDIGDPYKPDLDVLNKNFAWPEWFHLIDVSPTQPFGFNPTKKPRVLKPLGFLTRLLHRGWKMLQFMREYELVVSHVPFSIYAQFSKVPYVAFDAGAVRYLRDYFEGAYNRFRMRLLERGYRKAHRILVTNIDTFNLFQRYRLNHTTFMPFMIDTERYKPFKLNGELPYEHVIFQPARQYWKVKGNSLLIHAFNRFHKEYRDSVLVLVDWSFDKDKTRDLVKKLGLEKSVIFLGLMSKPRLIKWYNLATVVADQFVLKGHGTTCCEAMACGKPTVISMATDCSVRAYGEMAPILYADSVEQIYKQLIKCTDANFRKKIGGLSRRWVLKHHSPEVVVEKHLSLYKKLLH